MKLSLIKISKKFIVLICILMIAYLGYKFYSLEFIEIKTGSGIIMKISIKPYPNIRIHYKESGKNYENNY